MNTENKGPVHGPAYALALLDKGLIGLGSWFETMDDGREMLCIMSALDSTFIETQEAKACPALNMPEWLVHAYISLNDTISHDEHRNLILRKAVTVAARMGDVSGEDLERVRRAWLRSIVEEVQAALPAEGSVEGFQGAMIAAMLACADTGSDYHLRGLCVERLVAKRLDANSRRTSELQTLGVYMSALDSGIFAVKAAGFIGRYGGWYGIWTTDTRRYDILERARFEVFAKLLDLIAEAPGFLSRDPKAIVLSGRALPAQG